MLFTSWQFAVFVTIVFFFYYLPIFRRHQITLLVLASVAFYAIDQATMLPLLLVTVGVTYWLLIWNHRSSVIAGVIVNLLILAFFKYKFLFLSGPAATGNAALDAVLDTLADRNFILRLS